MRLLRATQWSDRFSPALSGLLMATPLAALVVCFQWLMTPDGETRALCAAAARTVLTSENPLHVQRGLLVVEGLNCDLRRTLRREGREKVLAALGQ